MKTRKSIILASLLTCALLSACGPSPAEQAATATQGAANIFATLTAQAPTATLTVTPSPTATLTPTVTASPTTTSTPSPTPTPVGFFYSQEFQFKLTTPPDWTVTETANTVQFTDPAGGLFLIGTSVETSLVTVDDFVNLYVKLYRDPGMQVFASSTLGKKDEIALGDGTTAVRQTITGKHSSGAGITMQITCAKSGARLYAFIFFGPSWNMKPKENQIDGIYETILLGEKPASAPALTNADSIAGNWSGIEYASLDPSIFSTLVELSINKGCTVGKVCGTVSSPQFSCSGDIALVAINGKTFTFIEQNMSSPACYSKGYDFLRLLPDGTLSLGYLNTAPGHDVFSDIGVFKRK